MSTTGEQVQVTPELLATVEENGGGIVASNARGGDVAGSRADLEYVATACPSVVLALIQRIRELESTNSDLWKMIDRIPLDCPNH